jgi:hypothetical protein
VVEAGTFFEVADGELDDGVVTMKGVDGDGVVGEISQKGVVTPVGPQSLLSRVSGGGCGARRGGG